MGVTLSSSLGYNSNSSDDRAQKDSRNHSIDATRKASSRVKKDRPRTIRVDYLDGPMKYLHNEWTFRDLPEGGCAVDFMVDFQFKSKIFEALAGQVFERALHKMTDAFETRAHALYSSAPGSSSSRATSAA